MKRREMFGVFGALAATPLFGFFNKAEAKEEPKKEVKKEEVKKCGCIKDTSLERLIKFLKKEKKEKQNAKEGGFSFIGGGICNSIGNEGERPWRQFGCNCKGSSPCNYYFIMKYIRHLDGGRI